MPSQRTALLFCTELSTLLSTINDLMIKTDSLPCHPEYKLLLYHRFVLSKLSWHLTTADRRKTWVIDNLGNIVTSYVRKWFELAISATISSLILNKSRYGINLVLPSTTFIECQTVIRNALKSSPNLDIKTLWAETSYGTNLQYDQFQNTKQVLKFIQHGREERINNTLFIPRFSYFVYYQEFMPEFKIYDQVSSKTCLGTFSIFLSSILIILFLLVKISVSEHFLGRLIAPFVSSQKLYNMLYPAASHI